MSRAREGMDMFGDIEGFVSRIETSALQWLTDALVFANLIQVPAVILTGAVAWLFARPFEREIAGWADRVSAEGEAGQTDWIGRHRAGIANLARPLLAPSIWLVGLWLAILFGRSMGWPAGIARIVANLLAAWLIIRIAADLVPYPALARMIAVAAWTLTALNIVDLLGPTIQLLDSAGIQAGSLRISLLTVIKAALSLAVLLWLSMLASGLFERRITKLPDLTPTARVLLGKLLKLTLVTLAVAISLTSVGFDMSAFAVFTGAIGVGIGFGLQKTVSNLFSGIILLLDKSIKPGDVIEVGKTYGWVSSLGARYVAVETRDGMEYLIPNEDIITQQVLNWTHQHELVRLKVPVRAPLDADPRQILTLMKEAARRSPRVLVQPPPNAVVIAFGESAIELELRFWIRDAKNGVHNIRSEVLLAIWSLFHENGIELPHAKRDVYLKMGAAALNAVTAEKEVPLAGQ
jgi:small-conductance mechanosensitive channel